MRSYPDLSERYEERLLMNGNKKDIVPVLLGGDIGAYSMAVSFARAYGLTSHVFARERLGAVDNFEYIDLHIVKGLDEPETAVPVLIDFAKKRKGERLMLIPCADWYMEMLEYARDALDGHFYFFIPDFEVWRVCSDKSSFGEMLSRYGISHPKTVVIDPYMKDFGKRFSDLKPPFVLKAADSTEYWRNPFDGMEKVFFVASVDGIKRIAEKIFSSGYSGKIVAQEHIGFGKRSASAVLTVFCDENSRAVRAVLGDVLLDESGPTARGNYTAIVTRELDKICYQLIEMLEKIGYTGVANIDIIYDEKCSYCLELNPRQGRSFDYIRSAGIELSELFIKVMDGERIDKNLEYKCAFWHSVSKRTVKKYSSDKALLSRAVGMMREGRSISLDDYKKGRGIKRRLYEYIHKSRLASRYSKVKKEVENASS
jgi:D-aspartate ligase